MPNNHYRCYFTDESDRIQTVEQIECEDDASAALKAEHLLALSKHHYAELWQGKRLVGKWGHGVGTSTGSDHRASSADPILRSAS